MGFNSGFKGLNPQSFATTGCPTQTVVRFVCAVLKRQLWSSATKIKDSGIKAFETTGRNGW